MLIIGCDLHTRCQEISLLDTSTGEIVTKTLPHKEGEAEKFYAELKEKAVVGIEATGYTQRFERLWASLGHEGKGCQGSSPEDAVKKRRVP